MKAAAVATQITWTAIMATRRGETLVTDACCGHVYARTYLRARTTAVRPVYAVLLDVCGSLSPRQTPCASPRACHDPEVIFLYRSHPQTIFVSSRSPNGEPKIDGGGGGAALPFGMACGPKPKRFRIESTCARLAARK